MAISKRDKSLPLALDVAAAEKREDSFVEELRGQTDRGAAIVAAAWVEEALTAAIYSRLHTDKSPELKKDDRGAWYGLFGDRGPLQPFSAKIELAKLLGMMTEAIRSDLHNARRIRNAFAHQITGEDHSVLTFDSPEIGKHMRFRCVEHLAEAIPSGRTTFVAACVELFDDFRWSQFFAERVGNGSFIFAKSERSALEQAGLLNQGFFESTSSPMDRVQPVERDPA